MGGAQPLSVTMNDGVVIAIEVDEARARRRHEIGYVDRLTDSPDAALAMARAGGRAAARPCPSPWSATPPRSSPAWAAAGERFDAVTDQTSAHDAARRLRAAGDDARRRARPAAARSPRSTSARSMGGDGRPRPGDARLPGAAARSSSTTATTSGPRPSRPASRTPSTSPGFVPALHPAPVLRGPRPVPLGRPVAAIPADILRTDAEILRLFPDDAGLRRWIEMAEEKVPFQGLPARICWLGYGERARAGLAFNELVRRGEVGAPIVIGRDHLDSGSRGVAEPRDGGDGRRDRRGGRLAAPQRAREHGGRGDVGQHPPRRRRRDRLQPARRDGGRRRRHGPGRRRSSSGC